ncbi:MAG: molybdopterin-dependent oxidoreductase, partial [Planctomycetota bacterium]
MTDSRYRNDLTRRGETPPDLFLARREFMRAALGASILAAAPGACGQDASAGRATGGPDPRIVPPRSWPEGLIVRHNDAYSLPDGIRTDLTSRLVAASHNNFYEFLPGRGGDVWPRTSEFTIDPWRVEIAGECNRPRTLDLDDLAKFPHEERLYHFRCVERWAMNV